MFLIDNLDSHSTLMVFVRELIHNHDLQIHIALNNTKNYHEAKVLISSALCMGSPTGLT